MVKRGFTLLEMVIVVSVLSILFLLTVPNIQSVIKIVDEKGCDALVKVVDSAILQYKLDYDIYPSTVNDLIQASLLTNQQTSCSDGRIIVLIQGKAYVQ